MSGDFVSLNFEYYADTFYTIDQDGEVDPSDYATMTVDYDKDGANYTGLVFAQWNDYNEDGTCQNDDDGNGIINATESIDQTELSFIGDPANTDGSGNYNVFFNSEELVKTTSIDLTHLYIQNRSSPDSSQWRAECMSLQGSTVDVHFEFQSDDDGRNGINDGFKGIGFNNITLQEYTFVQDAVYTDSRTNVDAEEAATTVIASHEFFSGVYRLDVKTVFDNTTIGKPWYNDNEVLTSNNIERVIFNVESVDISIGKPDILACHDDQTLECVLPIDSALTHSWDFQATNGVLAGDYVFYMEVTDMADGSQAHLVDSGPAVTLQSQEKTSVSFTPWNGWIDGKTYNISFYDALLTALKQATHATSTPRLPTTSTSPSSRTLRPEPRPSSKTWPSSACRTHSTKSTTGPPTLTPDGSPTTTRSSCPGRTSWWPRTSSSAATDTTRTSVSPLAAPCLRTSCPPAVPCRRTLVHSAAKSTVSTKGWPAACRSVSISRAETRPARR